MTRKILSIQMFAVALLHAAAIAEISQTYANSKTIEANCDTVWPAVLTVLTKNGFVLEVSDRAGGILQARHGGESKYRGAKNDMKAFTLNRSNFWTAPERFMIQGVSVMIVPAETGCSITAEAQFAALKVDFKESIANAVEDSLTRCRICPKRPLAQNWVRLQSNGRMEWMMLAETDHLVAGVGKPELPHNENASAPAREQIAPTQTEKTGQLTRDQPMNEQPIQHELTMAQRPAAAPKPWEVVSADGRVIDSNGSVCHYAWRISIKNNGDHELNFAGRVAFIDRDGVNVDVSQVVGLRVPAQSQQEFTGSKMMMVESAETIIKPLVQLSEK